MNAIELTNVSFQRFDNLEENIQISSLEKVWVQNPALIPAKGDLVTFENDREVYLVRTRKFSFHQSSCSVVVIVDPSPQTR